MRGQREPRWNETPEGQRVRGRQKNYLEKDCRERVKQNGEEELHATEGLVRQCGGLMRLLAPQDMMMVMMISIIYTFEFICQCQTETNSF